MRNDENPVDYWGRGEPVKRAYEQKPETVQAWLDAQYPAIEARAKAEGVGINWGDADGIYHPASFNNRLVLGLNGILRHKRNADEVHLHKIRMYVANALIDGLCRDTD